MASLWYVGDIAEAVAKAKSLGAIFIVFVEGKNDLTQKYGSLFSNEEIFDILKTSNFVAIKIEENSTAHQQFKHIYPHNTVPSIFFIGKNGRPMETITKSIEVDEFKVTINSILEKSGCTQQQGSLSESMIKKEQESDETSNQSSPGTSGNEKVAESTNELTPEEKIQLARQLIEQKREEKKKKEDDEERMKEIDRRKTGQNVQQMKKWQKDEELKQMIEERDKEKRENQAARDRVLAQIAQDKAERAAKFSKPTTSIPQPSQPTSNSSRSTTDRNTTRLQFRLPDGSSHTHEFQISDSLEIVHQYILNEMSVPFTRYTLSTTFPRREFTTTDNSQTLLDLQLVPNAVVLILPQNQTAVVSSNSGSLGGVFWWLLAPVFNFYEFIVGYFFGRPTTSRRAESSSSKRSAPDAEDSNRYQSKRQASDTTVIKRQGNIHRLRDRPDTDDDNNTWNGNSTQQM